MCPRAALLVFGLLVIGCGAQESPSRSHEQASGSAAGDTAANIAEEQQPVRTPKAVEEPTDTARKIIYVADVELVVDDFSAIEGRIPDLIEAYGGYVADAAVHRTQGKSRSGRWVARIPVERFEAFVEALGDLGVPVNRQQTAQDITAEYIDLEARIANKQRLEERLLQLLENRSGKLSEILEIEHELARVREEIETMQGRLRYLANRAALATVTISVREDDRYVPAQAPTFPARAADAWNDSLAALRRFGEAAAIAVVTVAPWLVFLVPLLLWYALRRRVRAAGAARSG